LVVIDTVRFSEMLPLGARGRLSPSPRLRFFNRLPDSRVGGPSSLRGSSFVSNPILLLDRLRWRWLMVIGLTGGAALAWYVRRRLPESPRWLESRGRH